MKVGVGLRPRPVSAGAAESGKGSSFTSSFLIRCTGKVTFDGILSNILLCGSTLKPEDKFRYHLYGYSSYLLSYL